MDDSGKTRITLIERLKNQHDEQSWDEFIGIYHGFIYATVRKMNITPDDAEDIVQQVLLALWKNLPRQDVRAMVRFRSWMAAIIKNCVIDFIRKRNSETERRAKAARDVNCEHLKTISVSEIEAITETQWRVHITNMAMERIRPFFSGHAMDVFQLSLNGMSSEQIAVKLGIKEPSVYQLRSRVKNRLAEEICHLRRDLEPAGPIR